MSSYHRHPALSRTHIAFVCEDSLWIADRDGSCARRLTAGFEEVRRPAFSPDGRHVAFSSNAEGPFEIYVCPVEGGPPRRLTFEGQFCAVVGFRPGGKLVYRSNHAGALRSQSGVYEVALDGTDRSRLPVGWALHVGFDSDDDRVVLGLNEIDSARWKRYRGGTAGDMWIGSLSRQDFRRLITVDGNPVLPTFVNGRVYFISDQDGFGNVWSCTPDGEDLRQHTRHRDFYVRGLHVFEHDLVYQKGAAIWRLDTRTDDESPVPVAIRPSGIQLQRKFVSPERHLQELELAGDGKNLVATVRGKALALTAWGGPVRWVGARSGVRYRRPAWLTGDREIVVVSDEGGEEAIEVHEVATGKKLARISPEGVWRIKDIFPSPVHRKIAVTDITGRIAVVDLGSGSSSTPGSTTPVSIVGESRYGAIREAAWSPDGRWLAYVTPQVWSMAGDLHLHDAESGRTTTLTDGELTVHSPAFDPAGHFLYVISERTFNPSLDTAEFGASCPTASRVYAYALSRDQMSPFDPRWADVLEEEEKAKEEKEEEQRKKDREKKEQGKKERKKATEQAPAKPGESAEAPAGDGTPPEEPPEPVRVDLDGLPERLVEFPDIPVGTYTDLQAAEHRVLFLSHPTSGLLDHELFDDDEEDTLPSLVCYDLKSAKQTTVIGGVKLFHVRDEKCLIWSTKGLYLLETGEEPPKEPSQSGHNRHSGTIDLDRLRIEVVPAEEWRQMFIEAWRLQRDHFWTETMAGVDWDEVKERYLPLLDRVVTRAELSDLIWELQGELGTSHAYEFGGDYPKNPQYRVGRLGADLHWDGKGYRIERILRGDAWNRSAASPLAAPAVNVSEGDRIVAVGARPVSEVASPESLLVHETETDVELTIEPVAGGEARRIVVHTLAGERALRYRDWVRRKRAHVTERSGGRLGYLHIPDMGGAGLSEFFRAFRSQSKKPGLVVDVRSNGGGFVSQIVIEHLRRKVIGYDRPRHGDPFSYPVDAVRGPIVAVCDQWAGSDGDVFCFAYRKYGIGPLVGKRTWGGVVGIMVDDYLADGTIVTQPEFSTYFLDVGWSVENHGVEPDIEVELDPASIVAGKDLQLDRAIDEAMGMLEKSPVVAPEWPEIPSRRWPRE